MNFNQFGMANSIARGDGVEGLHDPFISILLGVISTRRN